MRIALFGCGRWGRLILGDLVRLGCDVAVVDPDPESRRRAREVGAWEVATRMQDRWKPDGVVIATPAASHLDSIRAVRTIGVPVFIEKPMTVDRAGVEAIRGMPAPELFVMHTWRYHAGISLLAEIVRSGELGAPEMLRSTRSNWASPRTDVDPVWTLLPHDISIALEVLGGLPHPLAAQAELHGGRPVGMLCSLEYAGALVVVEVSTRDPGKRREVFLRCENGVAVLRNDCDGRLEVRRDDGSVDSRAWPLQPGALYRELAVFVKYLDGGEPPKCNASVGADIVDVVLELRALAGIDR